MSERERIEVDPEDAATFEVGDNIFGRVIERIDRERCVVWVRPPGRWYRLWRWARHLAWKFARGRAK